MAVVAVHKVNQEVAVDGTGGTGVGGAAAEVEPSSGVGVDGRGCWEESPFLSTLTFDLPGVLALTRRSCIEVGRGLTQGWGEVL